MTHRFPLKEIAAQAGLGIATIDRVINNRAHVSAQTRARVAAAIAELEGQESQLAARGRRMFFDFVIEAPQRFSREVQKATLESAPKVHGAVCRPRFLLQEVMTAQDVVASLRRTAKRGSQGVCLKARNDPLICTAVDQLQAAGIPVVTLVTDLDCDRIAYVGLDNAAAGQTAAYLVARSVRQRGGVVLTTKSQDQFLGEEAREAAFLILLAQLRPDLRCVDATGGSGLNYETRKSVGAAVQQLPDLSAVYSMGGGNAVILQVMAEQRLSPEIFVAHDLDIENQKLVQSGRLDFVLHHDLRVDMRHAFQAFLQFHGLALADEKAQPSPAQIITPYNAPTPFGVS